MEPIIKDQLRSSIRSVKLRWELVLKRILDMFIGLTALIIFSPLLLLIAFVIRLDSRGNPFHTQVRVGHLGHLFKIYKFRSMHVERSGIRAYCEVFEGDERVTRVGRLLRRFKLDELPQLVNVVLGDMSIIGPRPDIPIQVKNYSEFQQQRLLLRPGLTGIVQVSGNIWLPWSERIKMDVWYIQNWSLWLDLRIIWHTFTVLLRGERPEADPFGLKARISGPALEND